MSEIIDQHGLERIKGIHKLSEKYNKLTKRKHSERLLELMTEHVEEIKELQGWNDKHFLVETGDLVMLCFELLLEAGASINDIMEKCSERYEKKLSGLIEEIEETDG